ncbi:MAG: thymidine phosphorylase [Clostridia bacterium]|jgi:pyrimidine-nucleoside phosphorylase
MRMYDIIQRKRDNHELTDEQIRFFVKGYTDGSIPDYQAAALLMAIYFNGMNDHETTTLTLAMAESGDMIDLSSVDGITVDKHSTGGVGDKTSLIVAPCVASLGFKVAKMSGRGLGHTGGTVDKLESIPGYRTALERNEFITNVNKIGIALVGQSGNLAPADKKIYALRDVTATVGCLPLIVSSIMSKKIAAGSENILLDVKLGTGSFTPKLEDAIKLAEKMVEVGKLAGRNIAALITNMDVPLGKAIGNSMEIIEACEILKNGGPPDLREVCIELSTYMVWLCTDDTYDACRKKVVESLENGSAFSKFRELVTAQNGDISYIDTPDLFKKAAYAYDVKSTQDGFIFSMDTAAIGEVSLMLGAGREKKEDPIDYEAGIYIHAKTGDEIKKNQILATLFTNRKHVIEDANQEYLKALNITKNAPQPQKLIYQLVK